MSAGGRIDASIVRVLQKFQQLTTAIAVKRTHLAVKVPNKLRRLPKIVLHLRRA